MTTMGLLPSRPASFLINRLSFQQKYQIGQEGEGFHISQSFGLFSDLNRVLSGLASLGLAQTALKSAIAYGKERVAFGRPIVQFGAVSEKIAEDATLIEAGRWLCYRTLWLRDQKPARCERSSHVWVVVSQGCLSRRLKMALLIHGHAVNSKRPPFSTDVEGHRGP